LDQETAKRGEEAVYRILVERAHAAGFPNFSKAAISKIMTRPLKTFPTPPTIHALAAALEMDAGEVVIAAAACFDIEVHQPEAPGDTTVFTAKRRPTASLSRNREPSVRAFIDDDANSRQPS
jgi:hypothetical protein